MYVDTVSNFQIPLLQVQSSSNVRVQDPWRASSGQRALEAFCRDSEGWGPLSPSRYDLTPCFLEVLTALIHAFGIVFGVLALWYLFRKRSPCSVEKNWHFYAKLSVIWLLGFLFAFQSCLLIETLNDFWYQDLRFWAFILGLCALCVIGAVQYVEHWRSRQPNGVVLFFWLLFVVLQVGKLRSTISRGLYHDDVPTFATSCLVLALAITEFILEYFVVKRRSVYEALGGQNECPIEYADIFSVLTFGWMTPLMKHGYKQYLIQDDLWNLRDRDSTKVTGSIIEDSWSRELSKKRPSLWLAMFRGFGGPYYRATLIKTLSDALAFAQPQLLRFLIQFVDSYRPSSTKAPQPAIKGIAIALAMFVVSVLQTVFLHQYFQRAFETGMRVKAALTAMIYSKALRLSNEGRAAKSTGDIVNYMAVDTQRLQDLTQYGQMLWSAPFQIVLCMISLYQLVGLSMLAGVAVMLLMIPVNTVIAKIMKSLQKEQMKNKDSRTRLITEILTNMKSIKLFAWSQAFMEKLNHVRNDLELKTLRKIGAAQAFATFTWSTTPFLVSCSTFTVFVLTRSQPLTTDIVFPALTLFNLLTFPLAILPMVITSIVEATVAVDRLTAFFTAEELQENAVVRKEPINKNGQESVKVRDATFTWDRKVAQPCLENINLVARKGELTCIVGRVASGKSSLLLAILGDLWKVKGGVTVHGHTAYVSQQPWAMNATVRENIVFGHRWDPRFYELAIEACALSDDLKTLPDGDQTEVGERGISLSGGQKLRLTLARAVYARADVYLLDDCLSSVDQHVGRHLIDNVFGVNGLLGGKTRILATNSVPVLAEANEILLLREGKIIENGTYDQLVAMRGEVAKLIKTANGEEEEEEGEEIGSSSPSEEESKITSPGSTDSITVSGPEITAIEEETRQLQEDTTEHFAPIRPGGTSTVRKGSDETLRRASVVSLHSSQGKILDEEQDGLRSKQNKEVSEQGRVRWEVYGEYAKTSSFFAIAIYLVMLVSAQTAQIGGSFWLKHWSEVNQSHGSNPLVGKYIGIYFAFGIGGAALVVVQTLILWIFCSIEVSSSLTNKPSCNYLLLNLTFVFGCEGFKEVA